MSNSQKSRSETAQVRSKTFCALNVFKWAAMLLMFGIAVGEFYTSANSGDAVNWVFVGFCVVFGFILLWTGHVLAKHSIAADQANLRSRKVVRKAKRTTR